MGFWIRCIRRRRGVAVVRVNGWLFEKTKRGGGG